MNDHTTAAEALKEKVKGRKAGKEKAKEKAKARKVVANDLSLHQGGRRNVTTGIQTAAHTTRANLTTHPTASSGLLDGPTTARTVVIATNQV